MALYPPIITTSVGALYSQLFCLTGGVLLTRSPCRWTEEIDAALDAAVGAHPLASDAAARALDEQDSLRSFREQFHIPFSHRESQPTDAAHQAMAACVPADAEAIYLCGNSLGLQPRKTEDYVLEELRAWQKYGVQGHHEGKRAWVAINELVVAASARIVGAKPVEVAVMNSLTANLHFMMVPFYTPTATRFKILFEAKAFPSDSYAFASQASFHGYDPATALVALAPRAGESLLRTDDILAAIAEHGASLALVCFSGVQYYTGQLFDHAAIAAAAHGVGARVGIDLAHAVGNCELRLHEWGVDFAVWCNYKYMNSGPGAIGGCFVHERWATDASLPRFAGWWGHCKAERFRMADVYVPDPGAFGFQVSNPPVLQTAAVLASLELFDSATMPALRRKSLRLTRYLERLLGTEIAPGLLSILTPADPNARGAQLSLVFSFDVRAVHSLVEAAGVYCDVREPDVMRIAPVPLYNSYADVLGFVRRLQRALLADNHR